MTITDTDKRVAYTGTGANTALTINFPYTSTADILVTSRVTATGVETTMALTTNYTITPASGASGTLTPVDGATDFPSTVTWTLSRQTTQTQGVDLVENDEFPSETVEDALDRLTILVLDLQEEQDRCLKRPVSDVDTLSSELPHSLDAASNYLGFDASSEPVALSAPTDTSITSAFGKTLIDDDSASTARSTLDAQQDLITTRGDVIRGGAAAGGKPAERYALGTPGQVLRSDGTDAAWATLVAGDLPAAATAAVGRNLIVNGDFRVWQRGTPLISTSTYPNSNDSYIADHVLLLSESATDVVDVSQETSVVPTGVHSSIKLDVETANNQFGLLFPLEAQDAATIIGGTASLSFKAKIAALPSVRNLRAVILAWDNTADAITSDVVGTWSAEGVEHLWATNWTREGSAPSANALSTSWQTFTVENVSIDTASATNVAVFIYCDEDDMAVGEFIYVADVKLEKGTEASTHQPRPVAEEIALCQRYYRKSFPQGTAPAQSAGVNGSVAALGMHSDGEVIATVQFGSPMRTTPLVTTYNPSAANANWRNVTGGSDTTAATAAIGDSNFAIGSSGGGVGDQYDTHRIQWDAVAEL